MNIDTIIQIIQLVITILGLVFIWIQINRSRKDALTGSFISSLSERWLAIEDRRLNLREDDIKVYYKYLIPELNDLLKTKYQGNLSSFLSDYVFNDDDIKLKSKEKIFALIVREYAEIDAIFNYCEEEFVVASHLKLVDKKLWDYWEYYLALNFKSEQMRNYWDLRMKHGATYPEFVKFVEKNYFKKTQK
jgi:hypothetical protein